MKLLQLTSIEPVTALEPVSNQNLLVVGRGHRLELINCVQDIPLNSLDVGFRVQGIRRLNKSPSETGNSAGHTYAAFGWRSFVLFKFLNEGDTLTLSCDGRYSVADFILDIYGFTGPENNCLELLLAHNQLVTVCPSSNKNVTVHVVEHKQNTLLSAGLLFCDSRGSLNALCCTALGRLYMYSAREPQDMQEFSGHDGCIFSLTYDPNTRTIVAAAEDRGVHRYQVTDSKSPLSLFAHSERVWKVIMLREQLYASCSLGEVVVWDFSKVKVKSKKFCLPNSVNVWSLCYRNSKGTEGTEGTEGANERFYDMVVAGGDDGGLYFFCLSEGETNTFTLPDVNYFAAIDGESFLYTCNRQGAASVAQLGTNGSTQIQNLKLLAHGNELLKRCVGVSCTKHISAFPLSDGTVLLMKNSGNLSQVGRLFDTAAARGFKILLTKILPFTSDSTLVIAYNSLGSLTVKRVCNNTLEVQMSLSHETGLSVAENYATSAVYHKPGNFIILGLRYGGTALAVSCDSLLFNDRIANPTRSWTVRELNNLFPDGNAVLHTVADPSNSESNVSCCKFVTATRSNRLYYWTLNYADGTARLVNELQYNVTWIARLFPMSNGELIIAGFKSKVLLLIEAKSRVVLYGEPFVGSESSWDAFLCDSNLALNSMLLSFSKKKGLKINRLKRLWPEELQQMPRSVLHSAKITGCLILKSRLLTLSEDGTVKLSYLSEDLIKPTRTFWTGMELFCISSFNRGKSVLCGGVKATVIWLDVDEDISKVTEFSLKNRDKCIDARVKAICSVNDTQETLSTLALVGYSTGHVCSWRLANGTATHLSTLVLPSCVTVIKSLAPGLFFAAGTSKGIVSIVNLNLETLKVVGDDCTRLLHEGAILSMDTIFDERSQQCLLLTGGDDGSISLCEFTAQVPLLTERVVKRAAHSGAVTSLKWLNTDAFASTSLDQRVCVYRGDLTLLCHLISTIYDMQSLDCSLSSSCLEPAVQGANKDKEYGADSTILAVGGIGLEILKLTM